MGTTSMTHRRHTVVEEGVDEGVKKELGEAGGEEEGGFMMVACRIGRAVDEDGGVKGEGEVEAEENGVDEDGEAEVEAAGNSRGEVEGFGLIAVGVGVALRLPPRLVDDIFEVGGFIYLAYVQLSSQGRTLQVHQMRRRMD